MSISPPETRASLILRLQNAADVSAWDQFAAIYAPVVYRSARRLGLQAADADDCVQEVLTAVSGAIATWLKREDRGSFRRWLFRIARNTAIDFLSRRRHRPWAAGGDAAAVELQHQEASATASSHFDLEYRREVFRRAAAVVRGQVTEMTWQAFYRSSVLQQNISDVASDLGLSCGSIYLARSRVMKRLQQVAESLRGSDGDEM
ncbi:MAG: sigma-70 family RNA polymerase sigma factor [Planctomycetaceae bacterium]|nr:sigma-70 family RNA polymerase sigma factor [Planctomycetaceae bacterium]